MEPSGRNWWQPVANRTRPKTAQTSENRAVRCQRLPPRFHGKEGVSGSSPEEGERGSSGTFNPPPLSRRLCNRRLQLDRVSDVDGERRKRDNSRIAVQAPAATLVEAARTRVLLQHP
jgi:hypothetical protein